MKTIIYNLDNIETLINNFDVYSHLKKINSVIGTSINSIGIDYIYSENYFGVEIEYNNDYKLVTQIKFKESNCNDIEALITKLNKITITK